MRTGTISPDYDLSCKEAAKEEIIFPFAPLDAIDQKSAHIRVQGTRALEEPLPGVDEVTLGFL